MPRKLKAEWEAEVAELHRQIETLQLENDLLKESGAKEDATGEESLDWWKRQCTGLNTKLNAARDKLTRLDGIVRSQKATIDELRK